MRRAPTYLVALVVTALAACGTTPPPANGGGPQSLLLTPAGGTLTADGADGERVTIVFPPGSVRAPVSVTLTPLAADGSLARFRVDPLLLLELPAALTLTLPDGVTPTPFAAFAFDGAALPTYVPTTVDGTNLRTELRYFALPFDPPAAVTTLESPGGVIKAADANCAARLASLRDTYDAFMASNSFEVALRVLNIGRAQALECKDYEALDEFIASLPEPACARYADLVLLAQIVAADSYDRFTELLKPVMSWEAVLFQFNVECSGVPSFLDVTEEKFEQFITFYQGRVATAFTAEFDRLLNEARKAFDLQLKADLLGLDGASSMIEQQVTHKLTERLRERSYDLCVATADHYYLSTVLTAVFFSERATIGPPITTAAAAATANLGPDSQVGPFKDNEIMGDLQACASTLIVEVWADPDVPEEVPANRRELRPSATPGERNDTTATESPVEGYLVLRGPIEQLRCGASRTLESHELVVSVAGIEVHRLPTLAGNPEIDVKQALIQAGRSVRGLNTVDVVVRRESPACFQRYGTNWELFTVSLTADPVPATSGATATPATLVASDDFATFAFDVVWDDGGRNLTKLEVRYDLAGVTSFDTIDLASAPADHATGFTGGSGTGRYQQDLRVFCSERGKTPIVVTFTLEDAYGQRSDPRAVTLPVDYGGCP
jgi:hypothetical protein